MRSRSTAAIIGATLLLLGLALMSWLAIEQRRTRPGVLLATRAAAAPNALAVAPSASPAPAAETQLDVAATPVMLQPGDVEVCGFGVAKAGDTETADALERRANRHNEDPTLSLLARMRQSADARTRAAALMVERKHAALVEMALQSSDASIYAFAVHVCNPYRGEDGSVPADCQWVNIERAASLDADNGAVWLAMADKALERRDDDGVAAALHRASTATLVKQRQLDFAALALAALPPDLAPTERTPALVAALGLHGALGVSGHQAARSYCAKPLLADANRRQTCAALAELLVGHGHSFIDLAIGRRIGESAGWTPERVERVSARLDALNMALHHTIEKAPGGLVGCAAFQAAERFHRDVALHGEPSAAEALLRRSGVSDVEVLSRYRQRQAERAAAQASAADSSASAVTPAPSTDRSPAASKP